MTRPRRHTPEQAAEADRIFAENRLQWEILQLVQEQPGRMIRNPCGDADNCRHEHCYGDPSEAEHVRRTGLPSEFLGHP